LRGNTAKKENHILEYDFDTSDQHIGTTILLSNDGTMDGTLKFWVKLQKDSAINIIK